MSQSNYTTTIFTHIKSIPSPVQGLVLTHGMRPKKVRTDYGE